MVFIVTLFKLFMLSHQKFPFPDSAKDLQCFSESFSFCALIGSL